MVGAFLGAMKMTTRCRSHLKTSFAAAIVVAACFGKPNTETPGTKGTAGAAGAPDSVIIFAGTNSGPSGPSARDTVDGTVPIGADRAAQLLKDPALTCQGWSVEAEAQPSIIQFVVDVSGSMKEATAATAGQSKWVATRTALKSAIATLPSTWGLGISFFPNMAVDPADEIRPSAACVNTANDVPLATAAPEQTKRLLDALDAITIDPLGATPTYDAYTLASERVNETTLSGNRYMVLITDGQPTQGKGCVGAGDVCQPQPTDDILGAILHAKSQHLTRTFVVGAPGSERNYCTQADVRGWLSQAARTGDTASPDCADGGPNYCHFDLSQAEDFGAALGKSLTTITRAAVSCVFDVPVPTGSQELDPAKVNMIYRDGSGGYFLILPGDDDTCELGWRYTDTTHSLVQVCGKTCDLIQANPLAKLSILFGCAEKEIITIL
jgi:hypothetical protein